MLDEIIFGTKASEQPAMIYEDMELLMFPWKRSMEAVIFVNKHLHTVGLQKICLLIK